MKSLLVLFVVSLLVVFAQPVFAQDTTAEPSPVIIVTDVPPVDSGTVIVNVPVTPEQTAKPFVSSILEFVLGAIVGGAGALASAASFIRAAMHDPVKMTLAESAASGISPEAFKDMLAFIDTTRAFIVEATDGVPMITKNAHTATTKLE